MKKAGWKAQRKALRRWWRSQYLLLLARLWRPLLFRTTFIAITGSVGKTTCKECLAAILSARFPTAKTLFNQNERDGVPRTILRVRPWHRYAVVEVATDWPGLMRRSARLLRPDISIVLVVAGTHTQVFATLDDTAAEKAQLLEAQSSKGIAILNADDPRVHAMAAHCRPKAKTFGRSAGSDLRADEVRSQWPDRLSLRVHAGSETVLVNTTLVGEHWVNSVLGALLAAVSCGVPLNVAARELGRVQPFMARMQPVVLPSGATMLRDEWNGSLDTMAPALRVLQQADTARRVLVFSNISDSRENSRNRARQMARAAAQITGLGVFIGEHARNAGKEAVALGMKPENVHAFADLKAAALYLKSELRKGDLVLLKGRSSDHLSRIFFAQFGSIGCWKEKCSRRYVCDLCEELRPQFDLQAALSQD
jgi:UDP-N-acetylmuramoyl-tripeptide--D-alanyl-D-alanine ligase